MDDLTRLFETVAGYFSLLSEPTRIRILHAICHEERSVQEIVEQTGLTQSNISRQLNLMYRAGAVDRRKEGSSVFYRVRDEALIELCRTVCTQIAGRLEAENQDRAGARDGFLDLIGELSRGGRIGGG